MHHRIKIIVATSCSMMIAFGYHCTLDTPMLIGNSLFQRNGVDFIRHGILFYRCLLYEQRSMYICIFNS